MSNCHSHRNEMNARYRCHQGTPKKNVKIASSEGKKDGDVRQPNRKPFQLVRIPPPCSWIRGALLKLEEGKPTKTAALVLGTSSAGTVRSAGSVSLR